MAKSVTELLDTQTDQQGEMLEHMDDGAGIAPYAQAAEPASEDIELSAGAADNIHAGFQDATTGIVNSIEQQNKTLEKQQQQLSSILEVLSDQFAYQRQKDLHVEPEVQSFGSTREPFAAPEAMEVKKSEGFGLIGDLATALGGTALLKSLLGGGGGAAGKPGKPGAKPKPGGIKNKLGSLLSKFKPGTLAAGAAGAAGIGAAAMSGDDDPDKKKTDKKGKGGKPAAPKGGGSGILSKLKGFAKGGGTKGKLLMAALAGTAGFIGLDWFSDRQNEIRDSLYGIETDRPEEKGGTIASLGLLGAAGAGIASVAALVSKFDVGAIRSETAIHAADAKKNITKNAGDVIKAKDAAKQGIKTTQGSFSNFVNDSTTRLKETISSITSKISEKFSALKEKFFKTETKIQKVSETIKAKETALKEKLTKETTKTTVKDAVKSKTPASAAKPGVFSKAKGAVGKGIGKALPGVGLALEAYDLSGTLTDDNVSDGDKAKAVAKSAGGMAGAAGGAALGAAAGSVVPVVGTAIGGIVGGIAGYFGGSEITELVTENLREAVSEAGLGDAIGRAVAVPMSMFSDDARNALKSDMDNNITPKMDEYKKSAVDFFTPSEETKESIKQGAVSITTGAAAVAKSTTSLVEKSMETSKATLKTASDNIDKSSVTNVTNVINKPATSVVNNASKSNMPTTSIVNGVSRTINKPSTRIVNQSTQRDFSAVDRSNLSKTTSVAGNRFTSNNVMQGDSNISRTQVATPVAAGAATIVAGSAMSRFETVNNKTDNEGDFFSTNTTVATPTPTIKPEVNGANVIKTRSAPLRKSVANKVTENTENINNTELNSSVSKNIANNVAQGRPVQEKREFDKPVAEPKTANNAKTTIHINHGTINHNSNTVQNFEKAPAPEKVSKGQYEQISKVMMIEDRKVKATRKPFPKPEHMTNPNASLGSYKPKSEDIPTLISDFGLMFINNGFM